MRCGPLRIATLGAIGGRVLILLVLIVGVQVGALPRVTGLMLPFLALAFCIIELLVAAIYTASRNIAAIAVIDAAWVALIIAATMPVRI